MKCKVTVDLNLGSPLLRWPGAWRQTVDEAKDFRDKLTEAIKKAEKANERHDPPIQNPR